ncbi:S41 family peptidase [Cellulophaga sp. Hel_I_12]|uniref:S41 family peptidase n=1 Tax=Cellulophaga sp. Hel_I_12 TaxID=1249972 RepID=UPI000AF0DABF|nr:S41 family peptidase [Cellulophaga sp. Hel_I_12]
MNIIPNQTSLMIKNPMMVLFILFFFASCVSIPKYNEQIAGLHSPEDLKSDVDKSYKKLKKLHPKLYQFVSKERLDFKFDSLKQSITAPMSSTDFYKKLAPVVFEIRQGHIGISPPSKRYTKNERKELRKNEFEFYNLDFEQVEDAFLVKDNFGIDSTIIGAEVLKIREEPIEDLVREYKKYVSSDGYNTTFEDRFVALRFSGLYYKDKGYLDSLPITLSKNDSIFIKTLRRIPKDSIKNILKIRDSLAAKDSTTIDKKEVKLSKQEKKARKQKLKQNYKNDLKYGYIRRKSLPKETKFYTRNFDFIGEDSSIAYMKISNFKNGNYKAFYKEVFTKIDSADTKNLIIDLRDNTGGRLAEIAKLYTYLTDDVHQFVEKGQTLTRFPFLKSRFSSENTFLGKTLGVLMTPIAAPIELLKGSKKNGIRYYRFPSSKRNLDPDPLNYKGKLYVLINGNSFSASSILSTKLQATKRAIFVGEETGGHYNGTVAGMSKFVALPNSKVSLSFGMLQIQAPHQTEINGYGIIPDIEIIPTKKERIDNIDPELNWILQDIKK